jgi:hypothetical protein
LDFSNVSQDDLKIIKNQEINFNEINYSNYINTNSNNIYPNCKSNLNFFYNENNNSNNPNFSSYSFSDSYIHNYSFNIFENLRKFTIKKNDEINYPSINFKDIELLLRYILDLI